MSRRLILFVVMFAMALMARADNLGYSKYHPLRFGVDVDYPPMEYVDADGIPHGLDVEFTKRLMKRLNIPFTYAPNSWEQIADDILNKNVDLGMMVYSPYRKDSTNFSRAVFRLYYQIIKRTSDKRTYGLRNVNGMEIALMRSKPVVDTLNKSGAKAVVVQDLKKAFLDLAGGKYDAVICFRYQARYIIETNNLDGLFTEDLTLTPREYCYVSHDKHLIEAINSELDKMETEGVINDVYGNVRSEFGSSAIPTWVWFLLLGLIITMLVVHMLVQRRSNKRLRKEMIRAQRSEQMKNVFLGNVSHALRTPLNSVIGFSDILIKAEEGALSFAEQKQMLGIINKNGQQLLSFINELLQLSDIEGDELLFHRTEIDLPAIMEEFAKDTRKKVKPGVEVVIEGPGGHVYADSRLMRLVTLHCLDNAAAHTHEGRITLAYRKENNGLRIEVRDTGEGLPDKLRNSIFELLSEKHTYMQSGMPGLGLSICKAVVTKSNGFIGAESPPEGGTVLWHWVPVKWVKE